MNTSSYSFDAAWFFAERAKGWLGRDEAQLLYNLARAASRGRVVELGSYCGRSSIILAAGLSGGSVEPLVCVDTFCGSAEHQPGQPCFHPEMLVNGAIDTYPAFQRNLEQAGLQDLIEVMRVSTLKAAVGFAAPIEFLFVDADHNYEAVRADLDAWCPKVVEHGLVALHDFGDCGGPTRAAADLLDVGFERYALSEITLALRKPKASP